MPTFNVVILHLSLSVLPYWLLGEQRLRVCDRETAPERDRITQPCNTAAGEVQQPAAGWVQLTSLMLCHDRGDLQSECS